MIQLLDLSSYDQVAGKSATLNKGQMMTIMEEAMTMKIMVTAIPECVMLCR